MGLRTKLEEPIGEFTVDIWIPEIQTAVEVQGPQHYRKATLRRENLLREYGVSHFIYIPIAATDEEATSIIESKLKEIENEQQ